MVRFHSAESPGVRARRNSGNGGNGGNGGKMIIIMDYVGDGGNDIQRLDSTVMWNAIFSTV